MKIIKVALGNNTEAFIEIRSANLFVAGNGTGVTEDWSDKGIVDQ